MTIDRLEGKRIKWGKLAALLDHSKGVFISTYDCTGRHNIHFTDVKVNQLVERIIDKRLLQGDWIIINILQRSNAIHIELAKQSKDNNQRLLIKINEDYVSAFRTLVE